MPFIVLAPALAFQKTKPNSPTEPVGPEEVIQRGGTVPDYVPTYVTSALASAGSVVFADARPDLVPATEVPVQVRTPDQPPVLPSDPNGVPVLPSDLVTETPRETSTEAGNSEETPTVTSPPAELAAPPKSSDSKDVWEQYATHPRIGMTLEEAEAKNKTDLMAEVKRRYDAATK